MEDKQTSNPEDVKTGGQEFKVSKEDFEKLQELEKNKSIALKQEREEAEKLKLELEEHRKFKAELEEKEKLKKGKYEEVIAEKDKELSELREKAKAWDAFQEEQKNKTASELNELLAKTPAELLEENKFILDDLNDDKKILFLKKLSENKKPAFDNNVNGGDKAWASNEYYKAKEKWDIAWMLKYAHLK